MGCRGELCSPWSKGGTPFPPRMPASLYENLGVERGADPQEIRKAYLKLSKTEHPDKGGDAERFKVIQNAYEVLSDERKRSIYDQTGQIQGDEQQQGGGMPGGMPFGFPFDIGSMFGGMGGGFPFGGMGGMHGGGPQRRQKGKKAPQKIHEINLTLRDFFYGKIIQLKFERQRFCDKCNGEGSDTMQSCSECNGSGAVERHMMIGPGMQAISRGPCGACVGAGKRASGTCSKCRGQKFSNHEKILKIDIEPGMKPGDNMLFPNECSDNHDYEEPGDVNIVMREADEPSAFSRLEDDLTITVNITLQDSLLGCKKTLEGHPAHPKGLVVDIPAGTIRGETVVIHGEGMPCRSTVKRGNLQLIISMEVNASEKEILRKNAAAIASMFVKS
jgi:DnaJ homolog subfamily A member 2